MPTREAKKKNCATNEAKFVNFISNQNAAISFVCKMIIKENVFVRSSASRSKLQQLYSFWFDCSFCPGRRTFSSKESKRTTQQIAHVHALFIINRENEQQKVKRKKCQAL